MNTIAIGGLQLPFWAILLIFAGIALVIGAITLFKRK